MPSIYTIHIANEQSVLRVNQKRLMQIAEATLASEKVRAADISMALVDDRAIHRINRDFLRHDYPTDVISFLLDSVEPNHNKSVKRRVGKVKPPASGLKPLPRGAGKVLSGEIIISVEMAVTMAADYGWRPMHEVSLYLVHGLLHLCGYDDLTPAEQRIMRKREVEVLAPWKIVPHYAS